MPQNKTATAADTAGLTPVDGALDFLLPEISSVSGNENVRLRELPDRVLACDIRAPIDVPPADNSAMDGYAVDSKDIQPGNTLVVSQRIQAGHSANSLQVGTAARIFTGATIPAGADAVLMQEDCTAQGDTITVNVAVKPGQHIRRQGQDVKTGDTVMRAATRLLPASIGVIASLGLAEVCCYRRVKVAILSTGDELLEPTHMLADGFTAPQRDTDKIYNSNRYTLHGLLTAMGCEVVDGGIIGDQLAESKQLIARLAGEVDCIVSSGGVSVGEADFVKAAIEELGELRLWKLAMKPGKPLTYGNIGACHFFGLPGNPAAVLATFCIIVRPCLLKLQGQLEGLRAQTVKARARFNWPKAGSRQEYLRARYEQDPDGQWQVDIYANQSSGVLSSASWANAFAIVPIGETVAEGDTVQLIPFSFVM